MQYNDASEWPEWVDADVWVPTEQDEYIGPTEEDEAWWHEQHQGDEYDQMAEESAYLDRHERGLI